MEMTDAYRDQLYNVDASGRRVGFYPRRPKGRFYNKRKIFSGFLLVLFFALPWLRWNGEPFLMMNFLERKFIVFGFPFFPQDFLLLALLVVALFFFIFAFTSVLGRIWCGWGCPQTIFLELVYRRIEYWIDGDSSKQRKLAKADWTTEKIWKRSLKHTLFALVALAVSHTVIGFIIGMDQIIAYYQAPFADNILFFLILLVNGGAFYFIFAWFREQACIYICPYGRLQSVLLNEKSLVISYDHVRGEPRGKLKKKDPNPDQGDCIDCKACVAVCPTGIDIRNGTQLECVNCTACIDACDDIMDKINKPRGLVRYASQEMIESGKKFKVTTQAYVYAAAMIGIIVLFGILLAGSGDLHTKLLRSPGQTYTMTAEGNVTNLYTVQFINKSTETRDLSFRLASHSGGTIMLLGSDSNLEIPSSGTAGGSLLIELPSDQVEGLNFEVEIEILENSEVIKTVTTQFNGPMF